MLVESTFETVDCISFYNVCRKSVPKVYDPETEQIALTVVLQSRF